MARASSRGYNAFLLMVASYDDLSAVQLRKRGSDAEYFLDDLRGEHLRPAGMAHRAVASGRRTCRPCPAPGSGRGGELKMAMCLVRATFLASWMMSASLARSRLPVGSSKMSRRGSWARARAMATLSAFRRRTASPPCGPPNAPAPCRPKWPPSRRGRTSRPAGRKLATRPSSTAS